MNAFSITKSKKIIFLVVVICTTTFAPIPLGHFKGTYSVLNDTAKRFSILAGAELVLSGKLEKLSIESQNNLNCNTGLLQGLFKHQDGYLGPTNATHSPVPYITPTGIAKLLVYIETQQPEAFISDLSNSIVEIVKPAKKPAVLKQTVAKNIKKLLRNAQACLANNGPTHTLILGLLYQKIKQKHDVLNYMLEVNNYIPIFNNPDFAQSSDLQAAWLADNYQNNCENLGQDYESVTLAPLIKKLYQSDLPPQATQSLYAATSGSNLKPAADCVETALRGLFNILLYNPESHVFDCARLPSTLHPSPEFYNCYAGARLKPKSVNDICTDQGQGQQWMNVLSNHPEGEYKENTYDLYPRKESLLRVLSKILGTQAHDFAELCTQLSSENIAVHVKNHSIIETVWSPHTDIFTIDFTDKTTHNHRNYTLTLNLAPDYHSWLDIS